MTHQMEYLNEVREMQAVSVDNVEQARESHKNKAGFQEFVAAKNFVANENEQAAVTVTTSKNRDLNDDYE